MGTRVLSRPMRPRSRTDVVGKRVVYPLADDEHRAARS
jgi:hypothetical protein